VQESSGLEFAARYGPWAVVTGGSQGVGRAWAEAVARRGVNLVLIARRADVLEAAAAEIRAAGVDVRVLSTDITAPRFMDELTSLTADLDIGLVVHNVGSWEREHGWFLDDPIEVSLKTIEVNCVVPTRLAEAYGRGMCERGRGGLVLVGSLTGLAGQPLEATYSAAKAYAQHLAEALWTEFGERGVDVVCVPLGGTRTEALEAKGVIDLQNLPTAEEVVAEAIEHLGDGPVFVPMEANRVFFEKVSNLDRRSAANAMARLAYRFIGKPASM
jgi:short-subunit dehydrogenase